MDFPEEIKDKLIFALDVPDCKEAVKYVRLLKEVVGCFKVGLELFVKEGPQVLQAISDNSTAGIFLDLKLHDIPVTVQGALQSASDHGAKFITVHCGEGEEILETAGEFGESGLQVLAVTVLTSFREHELPRLGFGEGKTLKQLVVDRAWAAKLFGCAGAVCSGEEAADVKNHCGPEFKVVVPGIRPSWSVVKNDDQIRIVTPAEAVAWGADHLVVGRPIRTASDPKNAAKKILDEIADAVSTQTE